MGGGGLHIFIFRVFLSFKAVASVDYISFSGGEVQAGGGVEMVNANLIIFLQAGGEFKQKRVGGDQSNYCFL